MRSTTPLLHHIYLYTSLCLLIFNQYLMFYFPYFDDSNSVLLFTSTLAFSSSMDTVLTLSLSICLSPYSQSMSVCSTLSVHRGEICHPARVLVTWFQSAVVQFNSSPPSATYMHQWTGSALVQIMVLSRGRWVNSLRPDDAHIMGGLTVTS